MRDRFKKNQIKVNAKPPKRRGRPPKSKKAVSDENSTGQDNDAVKVKRDQRSPAQLPSPCEAAVTFNVIKKLKEKEKSQQVREKTNKQIKKNHIRQKGGAHYASEPIVTANDFKRPVATACADGTQRAPAVKMKRLHQATKRPAPAENASPAAFSDTSESKKQKATDDTAEEECPEPDSAKSRLVLPQVEVAATEDDCENEERAGANADSHRRPPAAPANGVSEMTAPPTTPGERTQKVTTKEKSKELHVTQKKGRGEKNIHVASGVGKKNERRRNANKKGDKKAGKDRHQRKDANKTRLKKTAKPRAIDQQVEAYAVGDASKEEAPNVTFDSSGPSTASRLNEMSAPSTATEENRRKAAKKEKSKKSLATKNTDLNKASKKRKVNREANAKTTTTKFKDQGLPSVSEEAEMPQNEAKGEVAEGSVGDEGTTSGEATQSFAKCPGYSLMAKGRAAAEDVDRPAVCKDTLAEYGKKPYMRPPPTAYLDERYTTMPKRRKEMPFFQASQKSHEKEKVAPAPQRQRCANCFATFSCAEDLQSHLLLQACSNRFGFDSDDEGESRLNC